MDFNRGNRPLISRRGLLMAFCALGTAQTVTAAPRGFHIDGVLKASDAERLEGYFNLGEFLMATRPTSPVYPLLVEMLEADIHVYVTPA